MNKVSKDLGISKSCPSCGHTIFRDLNFEGTSMNDRLKCPYCGVLIERKITKKLIVTLTKIGVLVAVAILVGFLGLIKNNKQFRVTGDFPSAIYIK